MPLLNLVHLSTLQSKMVMFVLQTRIALVILVCTLVYILSKCEARRFTSHRAQGVVRHTQ